MNVQDELRSLSRISENFRKRKGPKSKWPAEFQLRVLRLIDFGFSPSALAEKLKIPVQTYYHWRRVWRSLPKTGSNFIEVPVSDNLEDSVSPRNSEPPSASGATGASIVFANGVRIESVSEELLLRIFKDVVSS